MRYDPRRPVLSNAGWWKGADRPAPNCAGRVAGQLPHTVRCGALGRMVSKRSRGVADSPNVGIADLAVRVIVATGEIQKPKVRRNELVGRRRPVVHRLRATT